MKHGDKYNNISMAGCYPLICIKVPTVLQMFYYFCTINAIVDRKGKCYFSAL